MDRIDLKCFLAIFNCFEYVRFKFHNSNSGIFVLDVNFGAINGGSKGHHYKSSKHNQKLSQFRHWNTIVSIIVLRMSY